MLFFERNNLLPRECLNFVANLIFLSKKVYDDPEKDHDEAIGTVPEVFVEDSKDVGPTPMKPVEKSERRVNLSLIHI